MQKNICILFLILIIFPCVSIAEIKTYTHTVKQPFGGSQSPDEALIAAMAKAKREVLEIAGTYLETMTVVKDHKVESDDILSIAAGVLKAEIVSQKNYASENAFGIIVEAQVEVDTNILDKKVKDLLKDTSLLIRHKENQQREKDLLLRIKKLESENDKLSSQPQYDKNQKVIKLKKEFKIAIQSLSATALNSNAMAIWDGNDYTDPDIALEYLSKAISLDPNYHVAYSNRGLAWLQKGDYEQATSDFSKAIELKPKNVEAYNNRGLSWRDLGKTDQAISDFNKAIELDPKFELAYINRGLISNDMGKYDQAIEDYSQAIELNPYKSTTYESRGAILAKRGYYDQAISDFSEAIELEPNSPNAYYNRGYMWYSKGKYDQSISDFNVAIELNPIFYGAYLQRGLTWQMMNKYDLAINDYSKCIKLDPNISFAYNNRGYAYYQKGNNYNGCQDMKKSCELGNCGALNYVREKGDCK